MGTRGSWTCLSVLSGTGCLLSVPKGVCSLGSLGASSFFGKAQHWETTGSDMSAPRAIRAALGAFRLEEQLVVEVEMKIHCKAVTQEGIPGITQVLLLTEQLPESVGGYSHPKPTSSFFFVCHIIHVPNTHLRFSGACLSTIFSHFYAVRSF